MSDMYLVKYGRHFIMTFRGIEDGGHISNNESYSKDMKATYIILGVFEAL